MSFSPAAPRWSPDHQLVEAVLADPMARSMSDLCAGDKVWVVAGLHREGLTAEQIRDLLHCGLRTVRSMLAEPMAALVELHMNESEAFAEEVRLLRAELSAALANLNVDRAELARVREQRDRLIDAAMVGEAVRLCRKRGHLMDRYNTYTNPTTGKSQCIACRREDMAELRERRRGTEVPTVESELAPAGAPPR